MSANLNSKLLERLNMFNLCKKIGAYSPFFSKEIMSIPDYDKRHEAMDAQMQLEETQKKLIVATLQKIFDEEMWMFSGIKTQEFRPEGRDILKEIEDFAVMDAPEGLNNIDIFLIFNPKSLNKCSNITFLTRKEYYNVKKNNRCWDSGTFQSTPIYNEIEMNVGSIQFSYVEKAFADYHEAINDLSKKYEKIGKNKMHLVESIEKTVLGKRMEYSISALTKTENEKDDIEKMREIFIEEFNKRCEF